MHKGTAGDGFEALCCLMPVLVDIACGCRPDGAPVALSPYCGQRRIRSQFVSLNLHNILGSASFSRVKLSALRMDLGNSRSQHHEIFLIPLLLSIAATFFSTNPHGLDSRICRLAGLGRSNSAATYRVALSYTFKVHIAQHVPEYFRPNSSAPDQTS